ncbi:MAG: hypothetical protein IKS55_12170 [Oscillospiraceae bacterium]|nr:hypothetical protein [Oscillospiraceae bacterium]
MKNRDVKKRILCFLLSFLLTAALLPAALAEEPAAIPEETAAAEDESQDNNTDGTEEKTEEKSDWETRLLLMLQEYNADPETIGAGYYNFATGEEHYYNGDVYRVSGSMYKVPLNMLFLDWIAEGKIGSDESILGFRYSELLRGTIIDSNNDYAQTLWTYAGDTIQTQPASTYYHRYRILIAPIMGEDPENVDEKYYENNFFTPRQMITCLRQLYDGGEKYDRLISTMQQAEPEKYFKLHERRFNIAHKYGWFAEDPILYLNDCALCFTDDPIAIVLFTTGTENAYGVLAAYCTLMCDYAQETHEKRVEREQAEAKALAEAEEKDRLAAEEAAAAEKEAEEKAAVPAEKAETTAAAKKDLSEIRSRSLPMETMVGAALIFLGALAALIWFSIRHRKSRFRMLYGVLAIILTAAALTVCFPTVSENSYVSASKEGAQETVERFFDALKRGSYEEAEDCLTTRVNLTGGDASGDELRTKAREALRESWNCRLLGECITEKTKAWQEIQLQVLDYSKMEQDLQRGTREQLLELTRRTDRDQVYDENGEYRQEAAETACEAALSELLDHPRDYYGSVGLRIQLCLTRDGWKIVPNKDLITTLSGNLPQEK